MSIQSSNPPSVEWTTEPSAHIGRTLVAPGLPDEYGLFYTMTDFSGRLSGDDAAALRAHIEQRWGKDIGLSTCTQVHGTAVEFAGDPSTGWREIGECDGIWSDRPGIALGIKVADCLPVTLIDPEHRVIANLHSGWRGAAQGIVPRAIEEMRRLSSFDSSSAFAWLGPAIRQCCFEVGDEVVAAFRQRYGPVDDCVRAGARGRPHFDLAAMTRRLLAAEGIPADRIADAALCTRCEVDLFHSYRRDGAGSGRILAVAIQA
ncbi:MAG TPA: peptidoglycan editing factor PgeF [Thermoanaerobaculia bacterium]|nr:peptidoglycan editing factor PgeF [Thermoanaerobaculia bacterium]